MGWLGGGLVQEDFRGNSEAKLRVGPYVHENMLAEDIDCFSEIFGDIHQIL